MITKSWFYEFWFYYHQNMIPDDFLPKLWVLVQIALLGSTMGRQLIQDWTWRASDLTQFGYSLTGQVRAAQQSPLWHWIQLLFIRKVCYAFQRMKILWRLFSSSSIFIYIKQTKTEIVMTRGGTIHSIAITGCDDRASSFHGKDIKKSFKKLSDNYNMDALEPWMEDIECDLYKGWNGYDKSSSGRVSGIYKSWSTSRVPVIVKLYSTQLASLAKWSIDKKVWNMRLWQRQIFRGHRILQHSHYVTSFKSINIVLETGKYHSWPNTLPLSSRVSKSKYSHSGVKSMDLFHP